MMFEMFVINIKNPNYNIIVYINIAIVYKDFKDNFNVAKLCLLYKLFMTTNLLSRFDLYIFDDFLIYD